MDTNPITKERLLTLLKNESLIATYKVSDNLFEQGEGAIYYGTGLTTPRALSCGLPFDVLGMVLVAEKLR